MRRASKVDANQSAIVGALRAMGASVQPLHTVGQGCPDLAVGYQGSTYLIEIKDGDKPPSERKLTPDQVKWHASWRGQAGVAENLEQAMAIIGMKAL